MSDSKISVFGARVHNLKNVDVTIPRNRLTVITGLSGSGKSSLAFDTIFAEGQRRYIETFSAYARNFLGNLQRPDVDKITGLSPVISIEQKTTNKNPRSTVGTTTEIYDFFRLLYARASEAFSYETGEKMVRYTEEQIIDLILRDYLGRKICILSPLVKNRKGHYQDLFENIQKKGYLYVRVDGQIQEIIPGMKLDRYRNHDIEVVIDRLKVQDKDDKRLVQSVATAMKQGDGLMLVYDMETEKVRYYSKQLMCPTTGISYREPAPHDFSFNSPQGACPRCKGLGYVSVIDEDIETLSEVLDKAKGQVRLYLELKGATADVQMARDVARMVRERNMEQDCVLISMNYSLINYISKRIPDIPCGYLYFFAYGSPSSLSGNILLAQSNAISQQRMRAIHSKGKKMYCWTVNSRKTAQNMVRQRVDGIISDRYDIIASVLDHMESRTDYERIMDVLLR